jgi:hypothetical protein
MASVLALVSQVTLVLLPGSRASAANTPLNGAQPRPFYIVAHNPNTLEEAEFALQAGANALEPDVQLYDCLGYSEVLVIYHDDPCPLGPTRDVLSLNAYLEGVHQLAIKYPQLALIVMDVKSPAVSAAYGAEIWNSIRTHLNYGPVNLNVVISTAEISDGVLFDNILGQLGPREGVQFDEDNNAADAVNYFFKKGYYGNIGYGNGTAGPGPNLPRSMDKAAFLRASYGFPKAVTYVFALSEESSMHSFINGGVDGIIPDGFPPPIVLDTSYITTLSNVVSTHPEIRLATRQDNPFLPLNEAYGLEINTSDVTDGGTDADLTFTLNGCRGSATITVNSGDIRLFYSTGRMEKGNTDWVTIPSKDLGRLTSITVSNDNSGGNTGWHLKDIRVSSARYLGPNFENAHQYTATYNDWLYGNKQITLPLTPNFPDPLPTIECPAPITVANDPGKCGAVVTFTPKVDGFCPDVSAVCSPASGSEFSVGQTVVTCFAKSAAGPQSAPCSFTVTVQDKEQPTITCPAPMVVNATNPAGASVSYNPATSDNCPGATLQCTPVSGSVFAIGDTMVQCTVTDASGNQATCSFNVHVKGAAEQLADLIAAVNTANISKAAIKTGLLGQLNTALARIQVNDTVSACGALQAFIELISAQKNKSISASDADFLIGEALRIRAVIGC